MSNPLNFPIDAQELVPHHPPMLFIDQLLEADDESAVAVTVIKPGHLLAREDGSMSQTALLEIMAQTVAAMRGYIELKAGNPPAEGYLVGVRSFEIAGEAQVGDRLRVVVKSTAIMGGFQLADAWVQRTAPQAERTAAALATASIRVWSPQE